MTEELTGVRYLGCPYDIYGFYARGNSVNAGLQLFDSPKADEVITIAGKTYSYPKDVVGIPVVLDKTRDVTTVSEDTKELYTKMSAAVNLEGASGAFSAEVSARYSSSHTSSSYFYHAETSSYIDSYKLTLDINYAVNNLEQNFKNDVYNKTNGSTYDMTAEKLVEKYGTHFLYEAIFGGRLSYSQSFSKFSHSDSTKLKTKVEGNYGSFSGKMSSSHETDISESNSESNAEFWCLGGDPLTLKQGFEAWAPTLSGNFVLVDFTRNSLKRISELVVDDDTRKTEIDDAIEAVLGGGEKPSISKLTTSTKAEDQEEFSQGDTSNLEVDSGSSDDGYVVVGFGARVEGGDFTRIAVCYLNMSTRERIWKAFDDVVTKDDTTGDVITGEITFNHDDYETIGEVPDGCVLTGIGLKGQQNDLRKMVLHYQELTPANSTYNYLDNNLQKIAFRGEKEAGLGGDYEVEFDPGSSNGMVITGIGVSYHRDKNKRKKKDNDKNFKEKVTGLKLYRNILVETEIELTEETETEPTEETETETQPTDDNNIYLETSIGNR